MQVSGSTPYTFFEQCFPRRDRCKLLTVLFAGILLGAIGHRLLSSSLSRNVKLVVFTPLTHAEQVRQALGEAGAGVIGDYEQCSFTSTVGKARFRPTINAQPFVGTVEQLNEENEERIETVLPRNILQRVIDAIRKVHPYQHMGYDVYSIEN